MARGKEQVFDQDISYDEESGTIIDYRTSRGFPLGGLGTGGFSVFTDGGFGMFRTNHNWFKTIGRTKFPRGAFLALRCENGGGAVARILRGSYRGGAEYANITNIAHTAFTGRIPFFDLAFSDPALPAGVSLSGFTSIIPHNVKDSSLPAAFFQLEVANPTDADLDVTLLASFENLLGIGGSGGSAALFPLDGPVTYNSIRKNYAERIEGPGFAGLVFKTGRRYGERDPRRRVAGEYLLLTDALSLEGATAGFCERWNSDKKRPRLIDEFAETGDISPGKTGRGNSAAFTVRFFLGPGRSKKVNLYLLWWTPYHVIEKKQRLRKLTGLHRGRDYGHYYLNFFSTAAELAAYCVEHRERLAAETAELPAIVGQASIPEWLKRYVLNSTDSALINSVLPKDGTLYTLEGVPWGWLFGALTGTIDQRMASHPYTSAFFPEIDRRELLSFVELSVDGRVPHGNGHADIALSSHDVPYGNPIKSFNRTENWTDLPQSLIMQTGKTALQTGDIGLVRRCWPSLVKMTEFLDSTMARDIPEGITTYDYMHYRPSFVYTAVLHCATLMMMAELGKTLMNENAHEAPRAEMELLVEKFERQLQATYRSTMDILWDERGFFRTCGGRETVFTSALAGDWIARLAGLPPAVEYPKALSHSRWQSRLLVDAYPYMDSRAGRTRPLVHREADLQGNEMPAVNHGFKLYRVNNPWQSIGYQGIEAIFLGRVEEGLHLIRRVWDKGWHEGYPWDMDHWGMRGRKYMTHPILWLWDRDHHGEQGHVYMTHTVMWSVFTALTGVTYNAFTKTMTFSPRPIPGEKSFRVPVFLPGFWLMVEHEPDVNRAVFTVLKHFGEPARVERVRILEADGTRKDRALTPAVTLRGEARFSIDT